MRTWIEDLKTKHNDADDERPAFMILGNDMSDYRKGACLFTMSIAWCTRLKGHNGDHMHHTYTGKIWARQAQ